MVTSTPANSVRRGFVFHFRRAVPRELQARLGRKELACSLRTNDRDLAGRKARELYLASEDLFARLRRDEMLTTNQIAEVVQDFYGYFLERDTKLRLASGPLSPELRQKRIAYWQSVASQAREDLGGNYLENAAMTVAGMQLKRRELRSITPDERRQLMQALLRAGIDLAEALTARYHGDFNFEPRDKLLKAQIEKLRQDDTVVGAVETRTEVKREATAPAFKEVAKTFLERQIATKTWDIQTALQARKTFELWSAISGDKPITAYEKKDAAHFRATIERLPANYGKAAIFRLLSPAEILAADPDKSARRLAVRTVQRHISAMSQLWQHVGEGSDQIKTSLPVSNSSRVLEYKKSETCGLFRNSQGSSLLQFGRDASRRTVALHLVHASFVTKLSGFHCLRPLRAPDKRNCASFMSKTSTKTKASGCLTSTCDRLVG